MRYTITTATDDVVNATDITALLRTMPTPETSPQERAAWLERKADLLQRI